MAFLDYMPAMGQAVYGLSAGLKQAKDEAEQQRRFELGEAREQERHQTYMPYMQAQTRAMDERLQREAELHPLKRRQALGDIQAQEQNRLMRSIEDQYRLGFGIPMEMSRDLRASKSEAATDALQGRITNEKMIAFDKQQQLIQGARIVSKVEAGIPPSEGDLSALATLANIDRSRVGYTNGNFTLDGRPIPTEQIKSWIQQDLSYLSGQIPKAAPEQAGIKHESVLKFYGDAYKNAIELGNYEEAAKWEERALALIYGPESVQRPEEETRELGVEGAKKEVTGLSHRRIPEDAGIPEIAGHLFSPGLMKALKTAQEYYRLNKSLMNRLFPRGEETEKEEK